MGFSGAFGISFPAAVFKTAVTIVWMQQTVTSVIDLLSGNGWESPSSRMLTTELYRTDSYWTEDPEADGAGFISALEAGLRASEMRASIAVVPFGDVSTKFANDECSVCLCKFTVEQNVWQTPHCSHVFHIDCLDRWMAHHQSCPLCRSSLVTKQLSPETSDRTPARIAGGVSNTWMPITQSAVRSID